MSERNRKVVRYRKPIRINIGVVVFLIIFLYLIIVSIQYLNKEHISIYEVIEKNIADDNTCQGIILRKEKIFNTNKAGYINYYYSEGEKVAKNSIVYSVDESGKVYDLLSGSENENKVTAEDTAKIRNDIAAFKKSYNDSNYGAQISDFSYDVANTTLELTNVNLLANLESYIKDNGKSKSLGIVKSSMSGIISYFIDGMEDLVPKDITKDSFTQSEDNREQLRSTSAIDSGAPVYKMVTDEDWSIIIQLSDLQYEKVKEKDRINITFPEDNLSTSAAISTFKRGGLHYAQLDLTRYMVHFISQRFVKVELSINSAEGLKIPVSSVLEKDFYLIPLDYFTVGGNSNSNGVVKETYSENGDVEYTFLSTDIYYKDDTFGYVDTNILKSGDWIRNEKTQERYEVSKMKPLQGVYNVNKGYCVFRRIEKVYENEEYCIVNKETPYGLSVYDHIVVNANSIKEQDIIY